MTGGLRAEGLHRRYPRRDGGVTVALRGVSLAVGPGEVVAVVGPSGSGKTTLCRCLVGLEVPDEGAVWFEGQDLARLPEASRRPLRRWLQYVPQDPTSALDPQQTAREHLTESLAVLVGVPWAEARRRAQRLLDRLGIGERADALPRALSVGEQRRLTLGRVLALAPRVVVADEPTSGLDPDRRRAVLEALVGNLADGASCVWVTHEAELADEFSTRIVVLHDGAVVDDGRRRGGA